MRTYRLGSAVIIGLLAAALAIAAAGCAPGILGAKQGVSGAERVASVSVRTWHQVNRDHQMAIARRGIETGDVAGARAELDDWRRVVDGVHVAISAFDAADAVARASIALAESGMRVDLSAIAPDLMRAGARLAELIKQAMAAAATPVAPTPAPGGAR